ncbi:MAG: NADH-quinone oxidoreductase subunit H [Thermomicrobiales bacterium]
MSVLWSAIFLMGGAYVIAVLESWFMTSRFRWLAPVAGLGELAKEPVIPRLSDRVFYESAPLILLTVPLLGFAVLPLTPGVIVTDLATGALFLNAALAYVLVALVMAGWGSHGAYAMVAGWRFLGQFVGYGMLVVMPIAAVAMRAQSLSTTEIVRSQEALWNAVFQPMGLLVFLPATMALGFMPPIDLPVAPGELAGGVSGEYTGPRLTIFRLGRLVLVVTLATAVTVFFLGGWLGPVLPAIAWTSIKVTGVVALMLAAGRYVPRLREEQVLMWSWKFGIPVALANIFWVGVILLAV